MPHPTKMLRRWSGRMQSRFRRARPGSVLILVVALLVLMALIGTAWLSTARVDRYATQQNSFNTQVELLTEGVISMVKSDQAGDLTSGARVRPAVADGKGYQHADSVQGDEFLASRIPLLMSQIAPLHSIADAVYSALPIRPRYYEEGQFVREGTNYYVCIQSHVAGAGAPYVTGAPSGEATYWKLVGTGGPPDNLDQRPAYPALTRLVGQSFVDISGRPTGGGPGNRSVIAFDTRTFLIPDVMTFAGSNEFPAFQFFHPDTNEMELVPAADTDGDGIADALLFRVPVGTINGVDYYAAVRVVDNGSAVNPTVAWRPTLRSTDEFDTAATPPELRLVGNFFPTNINLAGLVEFGGETEPNATTQADNLATYRFGGTMPADPYDAGSTAYRFLSPFDHLWMRNGRRLGNVLANGGRALAISEGSTLAYRGGTLINPSVTPSTLETTFASTLYTDVYNGPGGAQPGRNKYTGPTAIEDWFNNNFDFLDVIAGGVTQVRALLAVRNGVAKQMPVRSVDDAGTEPPFSATALATLLTANPGLAASGLRSMPDFGDDPPKVPVNTTGWDPTANPPTGAFDSRLAFSELWRAYAGVMAEQWGVYDTRTPFSDAVWYYGANPNAWHTTPPPADWLLDPYTGSKFAPAFTAPNTMTFAPVTDPQHPARMFRSSLRAVKAAAGTWPAGTPRFDADQMVLLRSALAAVNAIDQRDADENLTVMKIPLSVRDTVPSSAQPPLNAIAGLYGHERQPYLTEIFVHTDVQPRATEPTPGHPRPILNLRNPAGYIAIEFHNPYSFPIDIAGCKLVAINRTSAGNYPNVQIVDLSDANENGTSAREDGDVVLSDALSNLTTDIYGGPTIIPPFGYLVLENLLSTADVSVTPDPDPRRSAATYRPPSSGLLNTLPDNKFDPTSTNPARPVAVNYAYLPNLDLIYNREIVLVRPASAQFNRSRPSDTNADGIVDPVNPPILVYGNVQPASTVGNTAQPIVAAPADEFYVQRMAPLDSYDFTGLAHPHPTLPGTEPDPVTFVAHAWHYARGAPAAATQLDHVWEFVYPGRYDANQTDNAVRSGPGTANFMPRHQGTKQVRDPGGAFGWISGAPTPDPWETVATTPLPRPTLEGGRSVVTPATIRDATYPRSFSIQMSNEGWGGPLPPTGTPAFPFNGFARDGDLLQVPFIGAYRVLSIGAEEADMSDPAGADARTILELNAVPIDSAFAEDTDVTNDPNTSVAPVPTNPQTFRAEQIGRFNPLQNDLAVFYRGSLDETDTAVYPTPDSATATTITDDELLEPTAGNLFGTSVVITSGTGAGQVRRVIGYVPGTPGTITVAQPFDPIPDATTKYEIRKGHYFWADDLFDYVTTTGPHADYAPDTMNTPTPTPVPNEGGQANNGKENRVPEHGLVNINTAPLPVLASVPFFPHRPPGDDEASDAYTFDFVTGDVTEGANGFRDNLEMAQAIINYRDRELASGRAPFRTLMDLYRVRQFQQVNDMILIANLDPGDVDDPLSGGVIEPEGDITPPDTNGQRLGDAVRRDFEEQFLLLTRVSNLITTRSDSFTNYILVQGWRGIGTTNPELVVQRRRAFTSDRAPIGRNSRDVRIEFFYND